MLISKQWIHEFVKIPSRVSADDLAKLLTLSTVEVEGFFDQARGLGGVVVGKIVKIEAHPNADKLKVCSVDVGQKKPLTIVCGGSNIRERMIVAVALVGSRVRWHGEGEWVELKPARIRGVESAGMIAASDEIGLAGMFPKKEEREIMDLPLFKITAGVSLAKALRLDDIIFEIDHKSLSNRPDLWGHYGMAREVGALFGGALRPYTPPKILARNNMPLRVDVKEKKLCTRYMAVAMDGIQIAPSPAWMQARLRSCGVTAINNIVDITNYVMLEIGQPTHAFDANRLSDFSDEVRSPKSIIVRRADDGEKIVTLDGMERTLTPEMLVIADEKKPLAIAGMMGSAESGVGEATTSIVFESANFDAASIRRTSIALGLRSESSARFEKSLDPATAELALARAVELTLELVPGARVASAVVDVRWKKRPAKALIISWDFFKRKIGAEIPQKTIASILDRLGFGVKKNAKGLAISVPSWRATRGISIPEDIAEEVLRIWGYDKVLSRIPSASIAPPLSDPLLAMLRRLTDILAFECGLVEVYNYSFESPEWLKRLGDDFSAHLVLANPVAKERPLIREHLIPNLLQNVEANAHRFHRVALFETGRVFDGTSIVDDLPKQETLLSIVYAQKNVETPFFIVSDCVARMMERLGISYQLQKVILPQGAIAHPGRFANIMVGGREIGRIGELHPAIQMRLGIPYRVGMAEIRLETLLPFAGSAGGCLPVPVYPEVARDIAFIVGANTPHADIVSALTLVDTLIVGVELFDVFTGDAVPAGKKSMAYRLVYRSPDRTLTSEEVEAAHVRVERLLADKFGADIRA